MAHPLAAMAAVVAAAPVVALVVAMAPLPAMEAVAVVAAAATAVRTVSPSQWSARMGYSFGAHAAKAMHTRTLA
jgi:hypothetical protein